MFKNITEVKQLNKESGQHFFEPDTMRFFESKIETPLLYRKYFITSEKTGFESRTRKFTIRIAQEDGSIDRMGDFLGFIDLNDAIEYLDENKDSLAPKY